MLTSELPTVLRELADRFEAAPLPDTRVCVDIKAHQPCEWRYELAQWLALIGDNAKVISSGGHSWVATPYGGDIRITRFFKPGLLGGKEVITHVDDSDALPKLREEFADVVKGGAA